MSIDLNEYARSFIEEHGIPAVSIAVWRDGQMETAAAGVLNLDTGVEATTNSVFQIGSISKVMTACLVMRLVEDGRVDLDAPVKRYLRDFMIADNEASEAITVRQLLDHTSGVAGDFFPDDEGLEGNLIARLVDRSASLPLVHPPGAYFSYSNVAYTVAGRLIEVVTGVPWTTHIKERLFDPLGMTYAFADPKEAIRFRAAMGHVPETEDQESWRTADKTYLPLGHAPCGSVATMRAADLIAFARANMEGGASNDGWLSDASVRLMQTPAIEQPYAGGAVRGHQGLGWMISEIVSSGTRIIQHNGATFGQTSSLQILPDQNAAFAFLMNVTKPATFDQLSNDLLQDLAGVDRLEHEPEIVELSAGDLDAYAGRYESLDAVVTVERSDATLIARVTYKHDPIPPYGLRLKPLGSDCFAVYTDQNERRPNMRFVDRTAANKAAYLFLGARLTLRDDNA